MSGLLRTEPAILGRPPPLARVTRAEAGIGTFSGTLGETRTRRVVPTDLAVVRGLSPGWIAGHWVPLGEWFGLCHLPNRIMPPVRYSGNMYVPMASCTAQWENPAVDDLQRLARAAKKSRDSDARAARDRAERNALIVEVLDKGVSQAAICRAVDLTREQVRRIVEAERKRRDSAPS